tara:strand:- start:822 stop:1448 length:627 start_codon:yes stop_codon:yes gene_type:complete
MKKSTHQTVFLTSSEVSVSEKIPKKNSPISNGMIGMSIFIVTEVMFFAALISAYLVIRSGQEEWPPWGQPRLPIETTALNTFILLTSGLAMFFSQKLFKANNILKGRKIMGFSILLGIFFLINQGREWIELIDFGLTVSSSVYGGLFYLIIGAHGFHVLGTVLALIYCWNRLSSSRSKAFIERIVPFQVLWYFVVLVWPILYVLIYLK